MGGDRAEQSREEQSEPPPAEGKAADVVPRARSSGGLAHLCQGPVARGLLARLHSKICLFSPPTHCL